MPSERAGEFYEEATRGRSASHHLQVKAALSLLYHVLGSTNPFAECPAPKFAPEKTDLRYHTSSQLGQLLRELREERRSYFGHLTYHLAVALFFTGCRFHECSAEERHLSQNTRIAYRRTWLKLIAWSAAEGLVLETLPADRAAEFYEEATRGRSASHHLQVKAALALLYHVLGSTNPFAECAAPKFAPEKIELRYHTASQLGQLLRELREDRRSYFGHLTYHLATALFFSGCRFHEWARLTLDRLVREPGGVIIAARLQVPAPI